MDKDFFTDKKVLVMGLGRFGGGVDSALFAAGEAAKVVVTDLADEEQLADSVEQLEANENIEFRLGCHDALDFQDSDIIIANPAVGSDSKYLQIARENNRTVTSQINIFFELCDATIIGITGANGKSTTAALTAHLLKAGIEDGCAKYSDVWLSGNIGNRPLLSNIDLIRKDDLVVLELSSFQAEQLADIRMAPKVSVLTNLTPNHLDRHGTFEDYCDAKENIFRYQKLDENDPAVSVFCGDDKVGREWFGKYSKDSGRKCLKFGAGDISRKMKKNFQLAGQFNLENLAAAVTVAKYFGVTEKAITESLSHFVPLPHRLEPVATIGGVTWYNDSISTTPQSTVAAIEAFGEPKIIIAGGYDKKIALDELCVAIAEKAKAAILIGQTADSIAEGIDKASDEKSKIEKIIVVDSLEQAVAFAGRLARPGDVVLLSPGCASYDMFENFQQRGSEFTNLVRDNCD